MGLGGSCAAADVANRKAQPRKSDFLIEMVLRVGASEGSRDESQGSRVDAVTQTSGRGAVLRDVPQMRVTKGAGNGCSAHAQAPILGFHDIVGRDRLIEARPALVGKFCRGIENRD